MEEAKRHSHTRRENCIGHPVWWDGASQSTPFSVKKRFNTVAPIVDTKVRDIAVQVTVPPRW